MWGTQSKGQELGADVGARRACRISMVSSERPLPLFLRLFSSLMPPSVAGTDVGNLSDSTSSWVGACLY